MENINVYGIDLFFGDIPAFSIPSTKLEHFIDRHVYTLDERINAINRIRVLCMFLHNYHKEHAFIPTEVRYIILKTLTRILDLSIGVKTEDEIQDWLVKEFDDN